MKHLLRIALGLVATTAVTLSLLLSGSSAAATSKHATPTSLAVVETTTTTIAPQSPAEAPTPISAPQDTTPHVQQGPAPTCGDGYAIPGEVVWRESRCDPNAFNPTGCGGRGCVGLYQEDLGHFAEVSPWNPNVSGSCYGLNPNSQADQAECATRLGPRAWG